MVQYFVGETIIIALNHVEIDYVLILMGQMMKVVKGSYQHQMDNHLNVFQTGNIVYRTQDNVVILKEQMMNVLSSQLKMDHVKENLILLLHQHVCQEHVYMHQIL
jgi:hypothetical protein